MISMRPGKVIKPISGLRIAYLLTGTPWPACLAGIAVADQHLKFQKPDQPWVFMGEFPSRCRAPTLPD